MGKALEKLEEKCNELDNIVKSELQKESEFFYSWFEQETIDIIYRKGENNEAYLDFSVIKHGIKYFIAYEFQYEDQYQEIWIEGNCSDDEMVKIVEKFYELDEKLFSDFLESIGGEKWSD